jgi:hypothetical protein
MQVTAPKDTSGHLGLREGFSYLMPFRHMFGRSGELVQLSRIQPFVWIGCHEE